MCENTISGNCESETAGCVKANIQAAMVIVKVKAAESVKVKVQAAASVKVKAGESVKQ